MSDRARRSRRRTAPATTGAAPPRQEAWTAEVARWLASGGGLAAVGDATARLDAGTSPLALGTALRKTGLEAALAAAVVGCAEARRRARPLFDDAERLLFSPAALEQASHPLVAEWRARRFRGATAVVDLCCGAGVDAMALARVANVTGVDHDEARCVILAHNAAIRGLALRPVVGDALRAPVRLNGWVHADPSRRGPSGRARSLAEYRPPVHLLAQALRGARGAALVLSPAVDLTDPALPPRAELEFLQVGDTLVEAVAWMGEVRVGRRTATATLVDERLSVSRQELPDPLPVGPAGPWLLEVAPAAVRARLHDTLGAEVGARRIARHRALLTTDDAPPASPWWRVWEVEAQLPVRPRTVRAWLATADALPLEVATHGVDADVDEFWRQLGAPPRGAPPRGTGGRRVHLVRLDEGARAFVCRSVAPSARVPEP